MLATPHLSTQALFSRLQTDLGRLQGQLAERAGEVATGKRADLADRLGGAAAPLFGLQGRMAQARGHIDRTGIVESRLSVMQAALQQARGVAGGINYRSILDEAANTPALGGLQKQAATQGIGRILSALNASAGGRYLFGGLAVDTPPMQSADGMLAAVEGAVARHAAAAGGRIETPAQADALLAEIASMFDDSHPDPTLRFTGRLYRGAPDTTPDLSFDDGSGRAITYGAKASEDGVRALLEGLHLLAAVQKGDSRFGDAAYRRVAEATVGRIDAGVAGIVATEARLGLAQNDAAAFREEQQGAIAILEGRIGALQDADPAETAAKLAALETQLQASFLATARILRLSLANAF